MSSHLLQYLCLSREGSGETLQIDRLDRTISGHLGHNIKAKSRKLVLLFFIVDVVVLYNSNFSFSSRLYGPLDVDLCRVKLHEPLRQIVRQPLLYIRDMVPKPCFEALVKLNEVSEAPGGTLKPPYPSGNNTFEQTIRLSEYIWANFVYIWANF